MKKMVYEIVVFTFPNGMFMFILAGVPNGDMKIFPVDWEIVYAISVLNIL
jgi:hypothetical protein